MLTSKQSSVNGELHQFISYLNKGTILGQQTLFYCLRLVVIQENVIDFSIANF
jgi:hypothetical protein